MQMKLKKCHVCSHCIVKSNKTKDPYSSSSNSSAKTSITGAIANWGMGDVPTSLHCFSLIPLVNVNKNTNQHSSQDYTGESTVKHFSAAHTIELKRVVPGLVHLLWFLKTKLGLGVMSATGLCLSLCCCAEEWVSASGCALSSERRGAGPTEACRQPVLSAPFCTLPGWSSTAPVLCLTHME